MLTALVIVLTGLATSALPAALRYDVPVGWISRPPASTMRVAEFSLPKAPGETEDAALAIFFFGGQGGSVDANLDRWIGQMSQPDGKPSKSVARTTHLTSHGLTVTLVDVTGTYIAEMSPGSADHFNKPAFRLRAAVVETAGGPYFVKLTGPAKTVEKWDASFMAFLRSLRVE
jgi:hypothetical protein